MKKLLAAIIITLLIASCNNKKTADTYTPATVEITETTGYFPVTNYIKGQISEIKTTGISPLKITIINKKQDSAWVKAEQFDTLFAAFLSPVIDSANLTSLFKETRFHDQTLNSVTFIYEPLKELPADMPLKRWDVYVTPQTGEVKRIYIEKYREGKKEMQLSWQSKGNCKIVYLSTDAAGNSTIEKEELIKWNFDEEE